MVRWMKLVVLAAGAIGLAGFFLPFFVFEDGDSEVEATPYQLLVGFDDPSLRPVAVESSSDSVRQHPPLHISAGIDEPRSHRSFVPFFFASSIVMLLAGGIAVVRRRMGGFLALFTLAASLFAIGGWLRAINQYRMVVTHLSTGATLLGVAGVISVLASVAVMVWREPEVVKKTAAFQSNLPSARLLR